MGGRPILIERLENINLTELYKITTPENLKILLSKHTNTSKTRSTLRAAQPQGEE